MTEVESIEEGEFSAVMPRAAAGVHQAAAGGETNELPELEWWFRRLSALPMSKARNPLCSQRGGDRTRLSVQQPV